jgi:plastocyanin
MGLHSCPEARKGSAVKTKLAVLFALFALVPFAVAACGDDDDDDTSEPAATTEATETGGDTGGGGGSTVSFTADPGGSLAFEEDSATATAGTVTLELTNDSSVPHDVQIEDGGDLGGTEEVTGGTATAEVELEAGEYTFYCSVPGHREAGMEGTLTVE